MSAQSPSTLDAASVRGETGQVAVVPVKANLEGVGELALVTYDNPLRVTVRRVSPGGEVIPGLGSQYQSIWVAVFKPDQEENVEYEIALRVDRPSLWEPFARCTRQECDAAFHLF